MLVFSLMVGPEKFFGVEENVAKTEIQSTLSESSMNYSEYKHYQNRIKLTSNSYKKLEETAQANLWEWFVEFEFSWWKRSLIKSKLEGKWFGMRKIAKEIPKGWRMRKLEINKRQICVALCRFCVLKIIVNEGTGVPMLRNNS